MKSKKKAFTLTELLIVVMVIGVLSAVVLPKFNKVLETRRTTEAEEMMAAVRTEQEQRCSLNKPYAGTFAQMGEVTSGLNNGKSKNFTYSFEQTANGVGIKAQRDSANYTLRMPSYADGRICCEGSGCAGLNKDYPLCPGATNSTFVVASADKAIDTQCAPVCSGTAQVRNCACAAGYSSPSGHSTDTESQTCINGNWRWPSANRCTSTAGCTKNCTGTAPTYYCDCDSAYESASGHSTETGSYACVNGNWVMPSPKCTSTQGCTLKCQGSAPSYTCDCEDGYSGTSTATGSKVCDNGTWIIPSPKCKSTAGCTKNCTGSAPSYTCDCETGYTGTSTATGNKVCNNGNWVIPSPKCKSTQGCTLACTGSAPSYTCDCPSGYSGTSTGTGAKVCSNGSWVIPSPKCTNAAGCCNNSNKPSDCYCAKTGQNRHASCNSNGTWTAPNCSGSDCTTSSSGTGTGTGTGSGNVYCQTANGSQVGSGYVETGNYGVSCYKCSSGGGSLPGVLDDINKPGMNNGLSSLPDVSGQVFSFYYAAADQPGNGLPGGGGGGSITPSAKCSTSVTSNCSQYLGKSGRECQTGVWYDRSCATAFSACR